MHKNEIYFPSYVWKNKLNYQYSDELTSSILEDYNKVKKHKCKFNLEKTTCYMRDLDDNDLNKFSRMDLIEKIISSISKEFEKYLKYNNINSKFHFARIWYSLYEIGMETHLHNHYADFSGAYYLKFDEKRHNSTFFLKNNYNDNIKAKEIVEPKIEKDDIIFFPSQLEHGSRKNLDEEIRIIISFDILCPDFSNTYDIMKSLEKEFFKYN